MPPREYIDFTDGFLTRRVAVPPRFRRGQRVKLPAELGGATAEIVDVYREPGLWQVKVGSLELVVSEHALKKPAPQWKPGDVVVVRFNGPGSTAYTYVRGRNIWPGEVANKTDAQVDEMYLEGKARPVLQAGGVPFDRSRL